MPPSVARGLETIVETVVDRVAIQRYARPPMNSGRGLGGRHDVMSGPTSCSHPVRPRTAGATPGSLPGR
jgi:hypothetical protein